MVLRRGIGILGLGAVASAATMMSNVKETRAQSDDENALDRIMRTKKLRIGGVAAGAPWTIKDQSTGAWSGIDWEMGAALAKDMGVEVETVETSYATMISDLQVGKSDVFFGLNVTPKRALSVDFCNPVYGSGLTLLAGNDFQYKDWTEMNRADLRFGVVGGEYTEEVIKRICDKAQTTRFKDPQETVLALSSKRVDVVALVWMDAARALKQNSSLGKIVVPQPVFSAASNIGIRHEKDRTLRDYINTWISYSQGLGTIRQVLVSNLSKFDLTLNDVPPGINL